MKNKIIITLCVTIILVGIIFVTSYKDKEIIQANVEQKYDKNNVESTSVNMSKGYERKVDNITIMLDIPDDWKYEELSKNEENDFYKFALKIYKNNSQKYAVLYYYNRFFGVCGTGRSVKQIELDNGYNANIGYYWSNEIWEDISSYELNKNIAIINYGLEKDEADELVNIIKTLDVTEGKTE